MSGIIPYAKREQDKPMEQEGTKVCTFCGMTTKESQTHTTESCRNKLHHQLQNERRAHSETRRKLYFFADSLEPLVEEINTLPPKDQREVPRGT